MALPVLVTKLFMPSPRPGLIARSRLRARLEAGRDRALTIVCAPAGFGKTTLLSDWLTTDPRPVAWLSLDEADNDPGRFLAYLVGALRTVAPALGTDVLATLDSPQPSPVAAILTALLNELAALPSEIVLVLDDYHLITAEPVHQAVSFVLDHRPPGLHVVLATRVEPPLPLARLRARGEVTEVSAPALRFTASEAAAFLSTSMGLSLSADDVAELEERTEGWIAGLQLAALALQHHHDRSAFIRTFTGDHRYVADYLVDEVLAQQPEPVRDFLLDTSILDRLHGPLCDAVSGQEGGTARLQALERGSFFIVPLDDARQWYRYHHLFADALAAQMMAKEPDRVSTLHRRASAWFEHHGSAADAIRHALAAGDFARAAGLIELAVPPMRVSRQDGMVRAWLAALPEELIRLRPVLSVASAWTLLAAGDLEAVETRLRDAERWLAMTEHTGDHSAFRSTAMVVVDEEEFQRLPGIIALYRTAVAHLSGNLPATVRAARRVLDVAAADDRLLRGGAAALLGLASWASGDLDTAHRAYAAGMDDVLRAGNVSDVLSSAIALADIRIAQGRLHDAQRTYDRALRLANEQGGAVLRGTADLHVGMSELHRERNDLEAAKRAMQRSTELGERIGVPHDRTRWFLAMARIREAEGDLDGALELLAEAERHSAPGFFPDVRPVAAWQARVRIAQGRLGEARAWARERGLSVANDLSYLREFEHITFARMLLAHCRRDGDASSSLCEVLDWLARLLEAADAGGRAGSALEILVLQALAQHARGDLAAALIPMRRALALAEPEGYVRTFVDEGEPMAHLLREAVAAGIMPAYAGTLLAAVGEEQSLVEPLSQRELDVLRMFATELSGPEIADALVIALSTVRTHTKRIYGKLDVTNRRAAVKRASELHLI